MELWIRSQTKGRLRKATDLHCVEILTNSSRYEILDGVVKLGEYSTKKQALDVLNEIENWFDDARTIDWIIYQMPEDKGVDYENLH